RVRLAQVDEIDLRAGDAAAEEVGVGFEDDEALVVADTRVPAVGAAVGERAPDGTASVDVEQLPDAVHQRVVYDLAAVAPRRRAAIVARTRRQLVECEPAAERALTEVEEEHLAAM